MGIVDLIIILTICLKFKKIWIFIGSQASQNKICQNSVTVPGNLSYMIDKSCCKFDRGSASVI